MSLGISESPVRVVFDTNVLISAIGFGGKPRVLLLLALQKQILAFTSSILLAEFSEVVNKKFPRLISSLPRIEREIKRTFTIVSPKASISLVKDEDDNRVLEAAVEGKCQFIISGDRDLLDLGVFKRIRIVTSDQFLDLIKSA